MGASPKLIINPTARGGSQTCSHVWHLPLGSTVGLDPYLYVKSFSMLREGMMPFTLPDERGWQRAGESDA